MFTRTTTINKILKLKKRVKGCQGGTSSGKTFGIAPIIINKALSTAGLECSIVAESTPHLRRGVIKDFKKILVNTDRWNRSQWHSTTSTYTFLNGSTIEFFSADDDSKLRGARRDLLYINEANNVSFEAYQELSVRTKQDVYLDWNPTKEFWFHEDVKEDDDVDFIILTYLDNEACPQSAIDYILKAKEKAKNSKYWANWYRVYGLGLVGNLEGTVFENWEEGEFNESLVSTYGMDFGFSPDPTTLVKTAIDTKQKIIYVKELFYAHKLGTKDIIDLCNSNVPKNESIVCDSAESREINEMRRANINALKCKKGKDSVRTGIKNMMDYKIIVTPESINIKKELRNYVWNDKQAGIPLKGNDHTIDPIRYCFDFLLRMSR